MLVPTVSTGCEFTHVRFTTHTIYTQYLLYIHNIDQITLCVNRIDIPVTVMKNTPSSISEIIESTAASTLQHMLKNNTERAREQVFNYSAPHGRAWSYRFG